MITMRDRVRRPIQANLKRFIFVVVVFSLALCLLGQIALSFYCFYDSHRGVMGDEVSVFLDSSLTDAQQQKSSGTDQGACARLPSSEKLSRPTS